MYVNKKWKCYAVFFGQYVLEFEVTQRRSANFLSLSASWRQLMNHLRH